MQQAMELICQQQQHSCYLKNKLEQGMSRNGAGREQNWRVDRAERYSRARAEIQGKESRVRAGVER
jgi:hypothetical protein